MMSTAEGLGRVGRCRRRKVKDKDQVKWAYNRKPSQSLASRRVTMATHACYHRNVLHIWLPDQHVWPRVP